jgi:TolA-binding protein
MQTARNASRSSRSFGTIPQTVIKRGKKVMASNKSKPTPAIAQIDEKIESIETRIADLQAQLQKLHIQRDKLSSLDQLKLGAVVIYRSSRAGEQKPMHGKIIFIDETEKGTWYTLRFNEGTSDEFTRKARLSDIGFE